MRQQRCNQLLWVRVHAWAGTYSLPRRRHIARDAIRRTMRVQLAAPDRNSTGDFLIYRSHSSSVSCTLRHNGASSVATLTPFHSCVSRSLTTSRPFRVLPRQTKEIVTIAQARMFNGTKTKFAYAAIMMFRIGQEKQVCEGERG